MRSFALAVAALLLVGACTDDPQPIEPKPTDAATTDSLTEPHLPGDATEETPKGAVAFVNHWVDVFNYATNTGQVGAFRSLNDRNCKSCRSYEREIARLNSDGAEVRNFRWTAGRAVLTEDRRLETSIRTHTYEVRDSADDKWSTVKGSSQELGFQLDWKSKNWTVGELYIPESK
jgi:hypothetical protein